MELFTLIITWWPAAAAGSAPSKLPADLQGSGQTASYPFYTSPVLLILLNPMTVNAAAYR